MNSRFKVVYNFVLFILLMVPVSGLFSQSIKITKSYPDNAAFICSGTTVRFQASTMPGVIKKYVWYAEIFSNGQQISTTADTLSYYEVKNYSAKLYVYLQADSAGITVTNGFPTLDPEDGPKLDLGADKKLCPGFSVSLQNLSVPGSGSYFYNWSNGSTSTAVTTNQPGTYTLTITANTVSQCKTTKSVTISNYLKPEINAGGTATRCGNAGLQLNAKLVTASESPYSYNWLPNQNLTSNLIQSPVATPSFPTTYTVTVSDKNGCKDTSSVAVKINPPLSLNVFLSDTTLCPTSGITLNSTVSGGTTYTKGLAYRYAWKPKAGLSDSTVQKPTVYALSVSGIKYKLTVTDSNKCTITDSVTIRRTSLQLTFTTPTTDTLTACSGSTKTLKISRKLGKAPFSFTWEPLSVLTKVNDSTYNTTQLLSYTKVRASVLDATGCMDRDSVKIGVVPLPEPNVGAGSSYVCVGTTLGFDVTPAGKSSVDYKFKWSPSVLISNVNINNPVFKAAKQDSSITYQVIVTSVGTGCIGSAQLIMNTRAGSAFTINTSGEDPFIFVPATFSASDVNLSYTWHAAANDTIIFGNPMNIAFGRVGYDTLSAIGINSFGCASYDTLRVKVRKNSTKVIYIPNIFSPASEISENKTFRIFADASELDTEVFTISIYNLFGKEIFKSSSFDEMNTKGWDAESYPSGPYTYALKGAFSDGSTYTKTGTVKLVR